MQADCDKCMATNTKAIRQWNGCGYEPLLQIRHPYQHVADDGPEYTVCPGYSCSLAEVGEVCQASRAAAEGNLDMWARDEGGDHPVHEQVKALIQVFRASEGKVQGWLYKPKSEGGGGS